MELFLALLSMLVVLGMGSGARSIGILTPSRRETVNAVAYYVALPALVFSATSARPLSEILSVRLVIGVAVAMIATIGVAWFVHRDPDASVRSVAIVQSYHSNFGYLGIPVVAMTFGSLATARAGLILGVGSIIQTVVTVAVLSGLNGTEVSFREELYSVVSNPVIVGLAAGLTVSAVGVQIPATPATIVGFVGDLALPLALLCVGAALTLEASTIDYETVGTVVGIKVVVMPSIALAVLLSVGADAATIRAAVVMFAMPTAVSTYVFASKLGGDRQLASVNVFATTVVSIASLLVVVQVLLALT